MAGPEPIERLPTPNLAEGRGGERPRAIVLHTTDGSYSAAAAWFAKPASEVSAHYLVGLDGRVAQFVDETDTASHAGRTREPTSALGEAPDVNAITIGIEFEDGGDPTGVARGPRQYEAGARLIAAIGARWRIPLDREHVVGHNELFAAKLCPGNLDIERLLALARETGAVPADRARARQRPLVCLLPARNAEQDLPGYLESVRALDADLIALDDGSTDRTGDALSGEPRLAELLSNPQREGYAGWDDGENRARLLAAAIEGGWKWVLFLDADERIDADDATALRAFLEGDALPGLVYGLALFRSRGESVEARHRWVYRLFAAHPGQALRAERLHFQPVPQAIPRSAWVRTTIRVRHLDSPERTEARRRKYAEADPDEEHDVRSEPLGREPERGMVPWTPRPPGLPALDLSRAGSAAPGLLESAAAAESSRPLIACLLPARNCATDLPGFLDGVADLADVVIALDDGSTDATASVLERAPLVERVLRNAVRPSYAGWDDRANRQRLLEAAAEVDPEWILFLDADERIDRADAQALREFVQQGADPACAYGFRVHRMIGDESHFDRAGLWAFRLFAHRPGFELPPEQLHLVPVPTAIPRHRWQRTTVRIKHLAGLDEGRREARMLKYREADPERRWQADYAASILATGEPRPWRTRPSGLPVPAQLQGGPALDLEALDPDAPVLSAIVISRNDAATIERTVASVAAQDCPVPFEVIVVTSGDDGTAAVVRRSFPEVHCIELDGIALPGRARNAGVAAARGEYVSFPGSHVVLPPGSLAARVRAHERGWVMVTGSIVNGNTTPVGWASYFLDHSSALPDRPSGELSAAPAHCSYVRQFLLEAGGFPEDMRAGEDTVVNTKLWRHGHRAWRERELQLIHASPSDRPWRFVRHHFVRGRALGRIMRRDYEGSASAARPARVPLRFLAGYARRRLHDTDSRIARWGGDLEPTYRRVRRLVMLGIAAAWAGTLLELARRRPARSGGEQRSDGDRLELELPEPGDHAGERGDRVGRVRSLVEQDDRAGAHGLQDVSDDLLRIPTVPVAGVDVPPDASHPGEAGAPDQGA